MHGENRQAFPLLQKSNSVLSIFIPCIPEQYYKIGLHGPCISSVPPNQKKKKKILETLRDQSVSANYFVVATASWSSYKLVLSPCKLVLSPCKLVLSLPLQVGPLPLQVGPLPLLSPCKLVLSPCKLVLSPCKLVLSPYPTSWLPHCKLAALSKDASKAANR